MPTTKLIEDCGCCGGAGIPCDLCSGVGCCERTTVRIDGVPNLVYSGGFFGACQCIPPSSERSVVMQLDWRCGSSAQLCGQGTGPGRVEYRLSASVRCTETEVIGEASIYAVANGLTYAVVYWWKGATARQGFINNTEIDLSLIGSDPRYPAGFIDCDNPPGPLMMTITIA